MRKSITREQEVDDAIIGGTNWGACGTCKLYDTEKGCTEQDIKLAVYLGDFIICTNYISALSEGDKA